MKKLTTLITLVFAGLDCLFGALVTFAFLQLFRVEHVGDAVLVFVGFTLVKIVACVVFTTSRLGRYEAYAAARGDERKNELVRPADVVLQSFPRVFSSFYVGSWCFLIGGAYAVFAAFPAHYGLPEAATLAALLILCAVLFGAFALVFPLVVLLTSERAGECSVRARRHGIALDREPTSIQVRVGTIAVSLAVGPLLWMVAVGYMGQVDESAEKSVVAAVGLAERVLWASRADALEEWAGKSDAHAAGEWVGLVDERGTLVWASRPPSEDERRAAENAGVAPRYDRPLGIASVRRDLPEGGFVVALRETPRSAGFGFLASAGAFLLIIVFWAPICSMALSRALSEPLERLTRATQEVVEEGNQTTIGILPMVRSDEVGVLSERFNDLLDMMRDLTRAAGSIANGDLRLEIARRGELPDAFRGMVESLRGMVGRVRQTSVDLAAAAAEILAASREQEVAATSQSAAMTEISHTMDSLSESAARVSESVSGVLDNAERTRVTNDAMVERIESLSGHTGRITELLDVIRDVADKSDLLALNGSLEASRAGEGGHGFALVATEMRRLAERVTASVEDVKKLVSDVRESTTSTIMATEEGRRLARGTTEAARQITLVSQQQRSGTEQVSESVREIASVVMQAAAATSQVRTSAQGLKSQADLLAELVRRFETAERA